MHKLRKISRRSFFTAVTGGLVVGGGVAFGLRNAAAAQSPAAPIHDSDKGVGTDNTNIGGARGERLRARVRLCSDTDSGSGADPLGESRTKRSWADRDSGPGADPVRTCPRPWYGR
jgi:hypothetical protein